jgi:ribosomal protein S18 acetylase RimI-like enzyme
MEFLPYTIRRAVAEDLDALVAIDAICFPKGIAYPRGELKTLVLSRQTRTILAESSSGILGFACLGFVQPDSRQTPLRGELVTIDVSPEFRRARVGMSLYQSLEDWLRASGGNAISLHVSVENEAAFAFYQRLGYRTIGRAPRYYLRRIDAWRMEKPLV